MLTIFGKMLVRDSGKQSHEPLKEGWLKCSLGRFYIKSFQLDSLAAGDYEGFFTLMKIDPCCHQHQGKFVLGLEAVIEKMAFTSQLLSENPEASIFKQTPLLPEGEIFLENKSPLQALQALNDDEKLFGELYPLLQSVKLDASQDRNTLRKQVNRLKEIGYRFDEKAQQWVSHVYP